jgi:outer membrane assembly lipoprotein YfiO
LEIVMNMHVTLGRLQSVITFACMILLSGCTKKSDEIRISNQKKPQKFSSYLREDGKVVRKWAEYRPVHKMPYEELAHEKKLLEIKKDYHLLIMYLDQLIKVCPNQDELAAYRLQLADIHYIQENYDKAKDNYDAYADLYPGSPFAEYALYRSVLTRSKILRTPDRDQTLTKELIEKARLFIKKYGKKSEYAGEVQVILHDALYRLFTAEVITFYFYLNNNMLLGAKQRLDYIKSTNLKVLPSIAAEVAVLEYELAIALHDAEKAEKSKKELEQKLKQKNQVLSPERQKRLARAEKQHKELTSNKKRLDASLKTVVEAAPTSATQVAESDKVVSIEEMTVEKPKLIDTTEEVW